MMNQNENMENRGEIIIYQTAGERILLQPGQYELVLHPQNATKYDKVQTKRFVIESSQTTKIHF